jgi:hypothetical protein
MLRGTGSADPHAMRPSAASGLQPLCQLTLHRFDRRQPRQGSGIVGPPGGVLGPGHRPAYRRAVALRRRAEAWSPRWVGHGRVVAQGRPTARASGAGARQQQCGQRRAAVGQPAALASEPAHDIPLISAVTSASSKAGAGVSTPSDPVWPRFPLADGDAIRRPRGSEGVGLKRTHALAGASVLVHARPRRSPDDAEPVAWHRPG